MNFMKAIVAAGLVAASTSAFAADITGAGATFPFPIYSKWADAYKKETGNGLNYQSIGSGAGIKQIQAKTVTFGASDMPLKPQDLAKSGLVQFPTVVGGDVPVVNLDGISSGQLKLDGVTQRQGPNFREMIAQFTVSLDGEELRVMTPSKRNFTTRGSSTTEAALLTRGASQLYVSLGETNAEGAIAVRIYHKPLVLLIWWGPVLMAFGGLLSLSDRRLRVGAPKPAKAGRALQPAE